MTALTASVSRQRKILPIALNLAPSKGNKVFYGGALLCRDSAGLALPLPSR